MSIKILTVCARGNCRSVAAAYTLKDKRHYNDVLACGIETVSAETFKMLANWADRILVFTEQAMFDKVPQDQEYKEKITHCDIGEDRWGNPLHEELLAVVAQKLDALNL